VQFVVFGARSIAPQVANLGLRGAMLRAPAKPSPQKTLRDILAVLHDNLWPLGGLVAQLVEQCPFNSKRPILAIFSEF
jgi:hypothetical protein